MAQSIELDEMTRIQNIGLALFVVLSFGFGLGFTQDCPSGGRVETYLLDGIASKLTGRDLCRP